VTESSLRLENLVKVAIQLCRGDEQSLRHSFETALRDGVTSTELREVILTSYLFDGYPTAIEGFRILSGLVPLSAPSIAPYDYSPSNVELWRERGGTLCRTIYGDRFDTLISNSINNAPELLPAMIVEGYGKVLARPELPITERELVVVTILAVKDRKRQLESHIYGAVRVGVEQWQIDTLLTVLAKELPADTHQTTAQLFQRAIRTLR